MVISVAQYRDIELLLEQVIATEKREAEYTLPSYSNAVRWRQRANNFRVALRKIDARERDVPPEQGTSLYDDLVFSLTKGSSTVKISSNANIAGTLIIGGETTEVEEDNELEEFLSEFETISNDEGGGKKS
jgi:hypothetical protein